MTVAVVDLLEVVEVDVEEGDGVIAVARPIHLVLEIAEDEAPVVYAGELVLEDQRGWVLADMLQKVGQLLVLHRPPRGPTDAGWGAD